MDVSKEMLGTLKTNIDDREDIIPRDELIIIAVHIPVVVMAIQLDKSGTETERVITRIVQSIKNEFSNCPYVKIMIVPAEKYGVEVIYPNNNNCNDVIERINKNVVKHV